MKSLNQSFCHEQYFTATLAWGVNLPAHLVIVKGTEFFDGKHSRYVDYPVTDVLQMMGIAGRPQFDDHGVACVFVESSKKNFYKKFLYHPLPVESCLGPRMSENLNAEIAIGTVNSVEDCIGYLDWTYYARRARMNPSYYGAQSSSDDDLANFLHETVINCLNELKEYGCILVDEDTNIVTPTHLGIAASRYYLNPRSPRQMQDGIIYTRKFMNVSGPDLYRDSPKASGTATLFFHNQLEEVSIASILYALVHTHEFAELPVRHNEEHLNYDLNEDLPWGPLRPTIGKTTIIKVDDFDEDIMADPHTK